MTDQCSTCAFGFIAPSSAGAALAGKRTCNFNAPTADPSGRDYVWPVVQDDFWCGEGIKSADGAPFAKQQATVAASGTFAFSATSTVTVTDAAVKASSQVLVYITSYSGNFPGALAAIPVDGGFTAVALAGVAITCNCGYAVYNGPAQGRG